MTEFNRRKFLEGSVFFVVVAVQIENVEVIGLQAREYGVGLLDEARSHAESGTA